MLVVLADPNQWPCLDGCGHFVIDFSSEAAAALIHLFAVAGAESGFMHVCHGEIR